MSGSPTESNSKEIQLKLLPLGPRSGLLPVAYPSVVPSTWCNFSALRGLEEVILQPAGHIPPGPMFSTRCGRLPQRSHAYGIGADTSFD